MRPEATLITAIANRAHHPCRCSQCRVGARELAPASTSSKTSRDLNIGTSFDHAISPILVHHEMEISVRRGDFVPGHLRPPQLSAVLLYRFAGYLQVARKV
jgi:hypothetical protein